MEKVEFKLRSVVMLCWIIPKNIKKELAKSHFNKSNFVERFTLII